MAKSRKLVKGGATSRQRRKAVYAGYESYYGRPAYFDDLVRMEANGMGTVYKPVGGPEHEYIVGIRGTVDARDWLQANARIPFGQVRHSPQYREAKELIDGILAEDPHAKIELSGHSLGGALAAELRREYGPGIITQTEVFNAAVSPADLAQGRQDDMRYVYHKNDPLRHLLRGYQLEDEVRTGPERGISAHSFNQFYEPEY